MEVSAHEYDLIVKYFDISLTADERQEFEELRMHSEVFRKEVAVVNLMHRSILIRNRGERFDEIKSLFKKWDKERKNRQFRRRKQWSMSIAATLTIIVTSYFSFFNSLGELGSREIFVEYFEPLHVGVATRGESKVIKAFYLYNSKKYRESIPQLLAVIKNESKISKVRLSKIFLANAYMQIEDWKSAEQVLVNVDFPDTEKILWRYVDWYLGLTYLQADNKEMAIKQFEKMSAKKSFFNKEVKEILSKLNSQ